MTPDVQTVTIPPITTFAGAAAVARAAAAARKTAEAEIARLKHELAALRQPPPSPEDRP